jgi:hypothetical protein
MDIGAFVSPSAAQRKDTRRIVIDARKKTLQPGHKQ